MTSPDRSPAPRAATPRVTALASLLALAAGACAGGSAPARLAPNVVPSVAPHAAAFAAPAGAIVARVAAPARRRRDARDDLPVVTRLSDLLVGRVAGVEVTDRGDALAVRVRGGPAFGDADPLVVIDGLPMPGGRHLLAILDPADVARIDVLKDVAATAVYGPRGAHGVLVVTTRHAHHARVASR